MALAGRPNVGKSTLANAIVGSKVTIASPRPQTTRRAIRAVATGDDWQLVLVDLPGVQRPRDELTERMQRGVERALTECDAALLLLSGVERAGPGDRFLAAAIAATGVPAAIAVNKFDLLDRPHQARALSEAAELDLPAAEVFPLSARTGEGMDELVSHLRAMLPEGPFLYEQHQHSDVPREALLAELIREQALSRTIREVPHSIGVIVEEIQDGELTTVTAQIWVETESQKRILVGAGGRMVKAIGTAARLELERELGTRVHLDLSVRVRRRWRADASLLDRLGL